MFRWIEDLYDRVRDSFSPEARASLDTDLNHGGYGSVFGASVEAAARLRLLTADDKRRIEEILDYGLLRKAKPYFMELIAAHDRPRSTP